MTPLDLTATGAIVLIWSSNFVVAKIGLTELPPILLMGFRFTLAALLLLPFLKVQRGRMGGIVLVAISLGGLHYSLMFSGLAGVAAGPAAVAAQLFVPFSVLLAWIVFRERLRAGQWLGMVLAFAGVYVLGGEPINRPNPAHLAMIVAAAFLLALSIIQVKRLGPINVFTLNAWMALLAAPQLFIASFVFESGQMAAIADAGWRGWGAVVFMAIGVTIMGHGLWYHLIGKYAVNPVVTLTLAAPAIAVLLATWILDEPLTARVILGSAATLAGVAIIQFNPARKSTERKTAP